MTYDEAMRWWFGRVNYELTAPAPSDLKLDGMRLLLERLGNPHERCRIVHVAGSKGKGSTSAMLAAIGQRDGRRVRLFTSPHLQSVEERIQIDGVPIARDQLAEVLTDVRAAASGLAPGATVPLDNRLSFFEIATAAGFYYFAKSQ